AAAIVSEHWVYVGADYIGLGVGGAGHAYLVGADAGHAVLDAVRAARQIKGLAAAEQTVVWGHSQGGGAALWTGVLAPSYAPDVNVVGVAALAPASDLPALFDAGAGTVFGKIVSAYLAHAYEAAYPETRAFSYVEPAARWLVRDIAGRCTIGRETLFSAAETMLLPREGIFWRAPSEGPFGARLAENTPRLPIAAPLLIAQGDRDDLVPAAIQTTYADAQCAEGQKLDYRVYAGRDHMSLLAPDSPLTGDLIAWTRARFAGEPAASTCPKRNGGR
ncbi:MAG: lipase family protein, partial [Hyphomonadaceae bacterium]